MSTVRRCWPCGSDAAGGGERVSRHFAKCLEGVGWDGWRMGCLKNRETRPSRLNFETADDSKECRRVGMSCFGTGCRTRGASSAGITSALPSRGRTDNDRGMPTNPDWMASGRQVKCAAGVGGDGDRIGGEWVGCPFGIVGEPYQSYPTTRAWHF